MLLLPNSVVDEDRRLAAPALARDAAPSQAKQPSEQTVGVFSR